MSTRRSNGEGTYWKVEKEDRYRAQYYDRNGKRRTLSAKTAKEIQKKLREALSKRDNHTLENQPSLSGTVTETLYGFLESKKDKLAVRTLERYTLDVERYLIPEIGHIKLVSLTPEIIEVAYSNIKNKHGDGGLSDNSTAHVHSTLRGALKRAVRLKKLSVNPLDTVDAPKRKRVEAEPLTEDEVAQIIEVAKKKPTMWYLMWRIHLFTGFRQGEILGLMWEDIDLDKGTIFLHQQLQRQRGKGLVLKDLKSEAKSRTIYLDAPTLAILRIWKQEQSAYRLSLGNWGEWNFIFTNTKGKPMEPRKAADKWARLLVESGIPHVKLHAARHTFATLMLEKDVQTKVVTHYLGHTNASTTQNIYQHMNVQMLKNTADLIGEIAV